MRLLTRLAVLALCAVAVLLVPASAAAKQKRLAAGAGPIAAIFLKGSNGYTVSMVSVDQRVALETQRKRVGAIYAVPGRLGAGSIAARFGKLGRIEADFHPIRLGRDRKAGCSRSPLEFGLFRGTIEFEGEDGYTSVDAKRAFGILLDPVAAKRCRRERGARASQGPGSPGAPPLDTHLSAISKRKETVTSFELGRLRGQSRLSLTATRQERRGKMQIFRHATTTVGGENAFFASGPGVRPGFAFVAAPKPFSGSAVFDAAAAPGAQWTGSLSAWLPGAGKVGLTGPDYAMSFCRRAGDDGCNPMPPVRSPLSALQGSGSQSQLLGDARLSWSRYLRNSASSAGSTP